METDIIGNTPDPPARRCCRAVPCRVAVEPARKQILTGFGPLVLDPKWTKADRTLLIVRTVRNNVSHGGKIQPDGEKEAGRNEKLVASSLTVLKRVAEPHDKVRAKFYG